MKLIKITNDHYVIVVDSEIKEGDKFIIECTINTNYFAILTANKSDEEVKDGRLKITHSTQPLEQYYGATDGTIPFVYHKIIELPLFEVKELLGEVDVEKKAEKFIGCEYEDIEDNIDQIGYDSFIRGYNQALEDNKDKKYTEEDMKECVMSILRDLNTHNEIDKPVNFVWTDSFKKHIQSLQLKTEWEVEIVDGKLKLK